MTHYCLDEIGGLTWTTRRLSDQDDPFVVCAVCARSRAETINERDAMRRRLHVLASNLAAVAMLEWSYLLGHSRGLFRPSIDDSREIVDEWKRITWQPNTDGKAAP